MCYSPLSLCNDEWWIYWVVNNMTTCSTIWYVEERIMLTYPSRSRQNVKPASTGDELAKVAPNRVFIQRMTTSGVSHFTPKNIHGPPLICIKYFFCETEFSFIYRGSTSHAFV